MGIITNLELRETGIAELDLQHKMYIIFFRKLEDILEGKTEKLNILDLLEELTLFTNFHFKSEENLMKEYKFPHMEEHLKIHKALSDRLFLETCKVKENVTDVNDFILFLKTWFSEHTQVEDYYLGEFLTDKHKSNFSAEINF